MAIQFKHTSSGPFDEFKAIEPARARPLNPQDIVEVVEWCEASFGPLLLPSPQPNTFTANLWAYEVDERRENLVVLNGGLVLRANTLPRYLFKISTRDPQFATQFALKWM